MRANILRVMPETIGFIGLGLMGRPMATNLLKAGHPLVVHSRSPQPVDDARRARREARATRRRTSRGRSRASSRCCPTRPTSSRCSKATNGVFSALQRGTIIIDNSSIAPGVARRLAARREVARRADARCAGQRRRDWRGQRHAVDHGRRRCGRVREGEADSRRDGQSRAKSSASARRAPVSSARSATRWSSPARWRRRAKRLRWRRRRASIAAKMREALLGGFAASRVLEVHGERILNGNFKPGFKTKLFAKDLKIACGDARRQSGRRADPRRRATRDQRAHGGRRRRRRLFRNGEGRPGAGWTGLGDSRVRRAWIVRRVRRARIESRDGTRPTVNEVRGAPPVTQAVTAPAPVSTFDRRPPRGAGCASR